MLDLIPGVSRGVFRENDPQSAAADAEYRSKRPTVLKRANYTCQFCGVKSKEGIEVHHLDCNHANNSEENLKPACVTCHPVNHLGEAAARFSRIDKSEIAGGLVSMAYMPTISQTDLSHLLRTIGHVMSHGTPEQKDDATELYKQLLSHSSYIESVWGSSKASHFAQALRQAPKEVYDARVETMKGVRIIFSLKAVKDMATKFIEEFRSLPIASWSTIYEQRRKRSS